MVVEEPLIIRFNPMVDSHGVAEHYKRPSYQIRIIRVPKSLCPSDLKLSEFGRIATTFHNLQHSNLSAVRDSNPFPCVTTSAILHPRCTPLMLFHSLHQLRTFSNATFTMFHREFSTVVDSQVGDVLPIDTNGRSKLSRCKVTEKIWNNQIFLYFLTTVNFLCVV